MDLLAGQMLSQYRLVEKIGEGGMGVVWKALDTKLNRHVAIKVLPLELTAAPDRRRLFLREARAAAAVTHPNIVTIHEVDETGGVTFLAMELVEGKTLRALIGRRPLPIQDALRIAAQIAEGLTRAHQAGVVHRDLKPDNVIVERDQHPKILDFGLAKLFEQRNELSRSDLSQAGTRTEEMTLEGKILGTAAYMSPEQARGTAVDARSDIFSFGIMLYEMVTGRRPFSGDTRMDTITAIIHEQAVPASRVNPGVPSRIESILDKCLQKRPADRYQHADDLAVDLREIQKATEISDHHVAGGEGRLRPPIMRWWHLALAGVLVAAIATALVMMRGGGERVTPAGETPASTSTVNVRRSVAVLGFKNLAARKDKAWLSTALSEMLTTELSAGGELRTVPGENIAEMKRNLSLSEGDTYSAETLGKIRGQLGSDFVVLGSFLTIGEASGGQIRLDLRLQDTKAGETVASMSETSAEADLLGLVGHTGMRLREELGAAAATAAQREALRATMPSSPEAARAYAEGLDLLRSLDNMGARDRLEEAAKKEPDHPMILMNLAEAWSRLGYEKKALEHAERAFQHSGSLPEAHRLAVEGRYREEKYEWDKAIEVYRAVWEANPDDLDAGLRLAGVQVQNRMEDALETLAILRNLPPPLGSDPRIDLQEALALGGLGRFDEQLEAGRRVTARGEALGAPLIKAEGLLFESMALGGQEKLDEARAAAQASLEIFEAAGDRAAEADALDMLASTLIDTRESIRLLERALAIDREIGNREAEAVRLNNLAFYFDILGRLTEQKRMYEDALALSEEVDDRGACAIMLNNLAKNSLDRGEIQESERLLMEALPMLREVGARNVEASALALLGVTKIVGGRLAEAGQDLEEARRILDEIGRPSPWNWLSVIRGLVAYVEDREVRARELITEALAFYDERGIPAAGMRNYLARLELDTGRPGQAEALARRAREETQGPGSTRQATAILARALAEQGRSGEAEKEISTAIEGCRESEDVWNRFRVTMEVSKAEISLGKRDEARRRLEALRQETHDLGFVEKEIEARLLLAEMDLNTGDGMAGRASLKAVEEDARGLGLKRFARLAAEAAARQLAPDAARP